MSYPYGEPLENIGTDIWDFTEFVGRDSVDLLARMIYSEAADQAYVGKQGVGHVALNRRNNGGFGGSTFEAVLLARGQFRGMTTEMARKPTLNSTAWAESLYIASNITTQYNPIGNRLYFSKGLPSWAVDEIKIGDHWFYNEG
ncbi:cell wall hydrolase [Syntrophomonas curvata]